MTAVDGYDVHRACRLRRKRLFYCIPENIPSIREGLFRYCSHLLKGYLPEELAYETAFCKAFFSSEASGKQFSDNLQDYLLKHTSSKEDRVRYLLNMDAIIDRYKEIKEEDKLPTRTSIAQTLLKELGLEKTTQNPAELIREMQQMRDYLYLVFSKNCIFHSYKNREFCYLDDPRGREFGSFVLEPPKDEALKQYLDCTLKDCESLQKLSLLFPHPDKSVESFFRNILSPKFLTKTETKTTPPSSFPSFAAFLTYRKEQLKMPPKACTKYLKDLFSFKAESLKTLNSDQIADLKALLSETFPLLKGKERSLAGSLFIEIIKNQVWSIDESASKAKELIQSLLNPFSPKEFKEALTIYSQLAGSVELPFKHSNELLRLLLETSAHPKEALLLLGQIPFDCKNGDEHCATWMTAIKKIQSKDEFHSQLMTFWKVWTECYKRCKPEETARLDLEINALAERTLDILKKSKHEDALYWASQIASITNLPSLAPLQKECHELISRWMELGGSRVVSFYMKSEHEILDKERERLFTPLFSSFLQAVFPIKNNIEQVVAVIKRGVEQVINREMPLENANCIQDCLEKPSRNKGFPQQLIASQVALRRYIKSKKTEEKFSPATFSQLKKLFIEKKDFASFEKCYDLLRLLIQSPSPDSASLFAEGLDLFEKTLVILQKSNDKNLIDFFPRLQDLLLMHQKWTDSEREKINNGIQTYTKLVASRKVSAASILEDIRTLIEDLDKAKCQKLKNISEERLKKNPEGDAQTWGTLLCCYKILNDPINIIRCSEKFLPFTTSPEDKYKAIQHKYGAYSTLGEVDKMIVSAQEVLKLNQDWQCYGALGLAYYYAHNWSLAIDNFRIANGMLEKDFCKEDGLLATQKNAELGLNSKLTELAMLVEKDMKAASPLSYYMMLANLYEKIHRTDFAIFYYKKIVERNPNHFRALMQLGYLSNSTDASKYYKMALDKAKDDSQLIEALITIGELNFKLQNWRVALWHYIKAYIQDVDGFAERYKIKLRIATLNFCLFFSSSPSNEGHAKVVMASVRVLLKKLDKQKTKDHSFDKVASLLSFALINSQSVVLYSNMSEEETPVGICRKQIVAEINKEYSLHVELLIQQQKWDQAKSILNAQQLLLTTQAEIAFNRFKYGLCNIQSNDWREGITLVIKNYMDSPSIEKRANLWTLIGQFIRVYKLLPPSEVAEIREKLKEIIGIMLFIPKNLEKELKVFFLYQEDEEVSWMDSTAPNFSQEIY